METANIEVGHSKPSPTYVFLTDKGCPIMSDRFREKPRFHFLLGVSLGLAVGLGAVLGVALLPSEWGDSRITLPEIPLHASATHSGENMAIATGLIDDDVEGLFTLDFVTGDLFCSVLNHRSQQFNARFGTNILEALPLSTPQKRPKYLMVTGLANFERRNQASPGLSVVYVVDANTGQFAAYGLPWHRGMARAERPQVGNLLLLDVGNARRAAIRD